MKDKEYRHGLVNAQIDIDLPLQIRALRKQVFGTQKEFAKQTGKHQSRVSALEKSGAVHFSLETLRELAKDFDVALIVRFAPFSELLDWSRHFNPDTLHIPSFNDEIAGLPQAHHHQTDVSIELADALLANKTTMVLCNDRTTKVISIDSSPEFVGPVVENSVITKIKKVSQVGK